MVNLGDKVEDKITGFKGVAIARVQYLNGCISVQVKPAILKDGSTLEAEWFDEQQLIDTSKATVGGPQARPPEMHP